MHKGKGGLVILSISAVMILTVATVIIYNNCCSMSPVNYANHSPYQQVPFEEAEQRTGFNIPLPTYVPEGYALDGIYMYPRTEGTAEARDTHLPSEPPVKPFHVVFRHKTNVLILWLYGGDTRDEEVRASTGGDVPEDFNLSGETVDVNSAVGVMEADLDEISIVGTKIHSRLIWRLPYTSTKMTNLTALFLALESDSLPAPELLEVARSVR